MAEYVPTTSTVCSAFAASSDLLGTWSDREAAFYRWLAAHDEAVRADAYAEGWNEGHEAALGHEMPRRGA